MNAGSVPENVTSRDVAKGAGTTLLARLGGVIDVIAQPLYVALFGLPGFGLYAAMWASINLIENLADLGMTSALQRTVPQARSEQDAVASLRAALMMGVLPCLAIAILVSIFASSFTHIFNAAKTDQENLAHAIRLFIWALPLWALVEILTSALRARRVFGPEIRLRLFWEQVARMGFAIAFWAGGFATMSLLYAHIASLSLVAILCVRLASRHYDLRFLFHGALFEEMWIATMKAGLSILPTNIIARIFGDAPTLALNIMLPGASGATAGGLFAISRKVSSVVQLVRTAFAYVLAPLASLASTGEKRQLADIYGFATRVSFAVAIPLGVVLSVSGPAILRFFGEEAKVALPALVMMVIARITEASIGSAVPIQQVIGKYRLQLVGSVTGLFLALVLGWFLVPLNGLTGMAVSVGCGIMTAAIIPVWQLHRFRDLHPFRHPFPRAAGRAVAIAVAGAGAALPIYLFPIFTQLPLLVLVLLGALWASCRLSLSREDRLALGKTGRRLKLVRTSTFPNS